MMAVTTSIKPLKVEYHIYHMQSHMSASKIDITLTPFYKVDNSQVAKKFKCNAMADLTTSSIYREVTFYSEIAILKKYKWHVMKGITHLHYCIYKLIQHVVQKRVKMLGIVSCIILSQL